MEEFEIKFLEVNVPKLEKRLVEIGAQKEGVYNYIRTTFDYPDYRMDKQHAWLRLRTDGKESTLTFKKRMGVKSNNGSIPDEGMQEIEILIDNPDKTCEMLKAIGLIVKHEAKNKRVRYFKKDITFDIDFWPQIPPYLEIESNSFGKAKIAARKLGFNPKNALICSTNQVYKKYGYNLGDYSHINFERMIKK